MVDGIIQASYIWTAEEFLAASEANIRRGRPLMVLLWGSRLLALLLALFGCAFLVFGKEARWAGLAFLTPALSLAWSASPAGSKRLMRSAFAEAGAMAQPDQTITFVIDESRIRWLTADTESSWAWELVPLVVEVPGGYLVHHAGVGHWLPNHAFTDETDREAFAALAKRRAAKFVSRVRKVEPDPFS